MVALHRRVAVDARIHQAALDVAALAGDRVAGAVGDDGGLMRRDPSASAPVLVMAVGDTDGTVEKVKQAGGALVGEILDIPGVGRYARVKDSEGNVIGLLQPTMSR